MYKKQKNGLNRSMNRKKVFEEEITTLQSHVNMSH